MHRTLLIAGAAAGAAAVVELVPVPDPELDHRILRARAQAPVTLEAVAAGQAAARLVRRLLDAEPAQDLGEVVYPLLHRELRLPPPRRVAEVPQVQVVEPDEVMLWGQYGRRTTQVGVDVLR